MNLVCYSSPNRLAAATNLNCRTDLADVGVVQGGVDLVEHEERSRLVAATRTVFVRQNRRDPETKFLKNCCLSLRHFCDTRSELDPAPTQRKHACFDPKFDEKAARVFVFHVIFFAVVT